MELVRKLAVLIQMMPPSLLTSGGSPAIAPGPRSSNCQALAQRKNTLIHRTVVVLCQPSGCPNLWRAPVARRARAEKRIRHAFWPECLLCDVTVVWGEEYAEAFVDTEENCMGKPGFDAFWRQSCSLQLQHGSAPGSSIPYCIVPSGTDGREAHGIHPKRVQ